MFMKVWVIFFMSAVQINGTTWLLMNNGKPINPDYATASAKSPSVCFDASYNLLYVVYQGSTFPYDGIVLAQFNTVQLTNITNWVQPLTAISNFSYSNNYKPVIAAMGSGGVVVYDPPSTVTAGLKALKFTIGSYPSYNLTGTTEFTIPGTRVGPTWGSINIISTSNAQAVNNNSTTEYGSEYKSIISYSYGSGPYTAK